MLDASVCSWRAVSSGGRPLGCLGGVERGPAGVLPRSKAKGDWPIEQRPFNKEAIHGQEGGPTMERTRLGWEPAQQGGK